jgi:hypothetical protein
MFSTQIQLAYSSEIFGVGSIAGGPWGCSQISLRGGVQCMLFPETINVTRLVNLAKEHERARKIDSLRNIQNQKIFLFHGNIDSVVLPLGSKLLREFYVLLGKKLEEIDLVNINVEHAMITDDFGNTCEYLGTPFINNCHYDLAGAILKKMYGNDLKPPVKPLDSNVKNFFYNNIDKII